MTYNVFGGTLNPTLLLGLSVLELGPNTRQTDGQTDTAHRFIMPSFLSTVVGA